MPRFAIEMLSLKKPLLDSSWLLFQLAAIIDSSIQGWAGLAGWLACWLASYAGWLAGLTVWLDFHRFW